MDVPVMMALVLEETSSIEGTRFSFFHNLWLLKLLKLKLCFVLSSNVVILLDKVELPKLTPGVVVNNVSGVEIFSLKQTNAINILWF